MKRLGQRVVSVLLVCCLCAGLTGCGALDEARARHAAWSETGSVLHGETEYLLIEGSEYLYPSIDYLSDPLRVTAPDVPVLLSFFLQELLYSSADGIFLESFETGLLYCRADRYAEVTQKLQNGFDTVGYCYDYYTYDEESYDYVEHTYRLTDEEVAAVDAVLAAGTATVIPAVADVAYDYAVELMSCDESMLFRYYVLDVCSIDGVYYILGFDGDTNWTIQVPAQYTAGFDSMLKAPREQYEEEESWYEDDYGDYDEDYDESLDFVI